MKSFKEFILFFSVVLISSFGIKAQEVISTQGASYFNAYVKWDFTIGETVIFTGSSSNNVITQGFHQPLKAFYVAQMETVSETLTSLYGQVQLQPDM